MASSNVADECRMAVRLSSWRSSVSFFRRVGGFLAGVEAASGKVAVAATDVRLAVAGSVTGLAGWAGMRRLLCGNGTGSDERVDALCGHAQFGQDVARVLAQQRGAVAHGAGGL